MSGNFFLGKMIKVLPSRALDLVFPWHLATFFSRLLFTLFIENDTCVFVNSRSQLKLYLDYSTKRLLETLHVPE